jgi:phosphate transport system substrate-binding protein
MSFNKTTIFILCLGLLFGCKPGKSEQNQNKLSSEKKKEISGSFTISGAYALYPLVRKWSDDFMKIHSTVKIIITESGTGQGIDDLQSKKSLLAMISRPLTDSELGEGIWTVPVAKDGIAPIVNQKNPYLKRILDYGLSPEEFLKVFTSEKPVTWGELLDTSRKEKVLVFRRKDESGAADVFAEFLNKESDDLKGTGVTGDDEMIKSVQIVPADLDYDNKIDRKEIPFSNLEKAHRGLWLGLYPKSLCRELTIGSLGKPSDSTVVEFLKYILTEGQKDVKTSGLCELNDVYIGYSIDKLK